jgi:hypothetical protein
MSIQTPTNLDFLIQFVRLRIGDTSQPYRYLDEWIRTALVSAVDKLGKWNNFKYLLDADYNIYRNPNASFVFSEDSFGIIEPSDKDVIVLMASIILLEGSLENSAWNFHSWRDAEISYSNLEQSRTRNEILNKLWEELYNTLKPPTKRLGKTRGAKLPGYLGNRYERGDEP